MSDYGLSISVPTKFDRVLKDLSFIPDVQKESIAYTGLFGGNEASSLSNIATASVSSNVSGIVTRSPDRITYNEGYFGFTGPGADLSQGIGVRGNIKLASVNQNGFPCSMACSFRKVKKTKEAYRRLYPLFSYFLNASSTTGTPALFVALCIDDAGNHRISAWSGSIGGVLSDAQARQCSVPVDWSVTDDLITAAVSRAASGLVTLVVKAGSSPAVTASFPFPVAVNSGATGDVNACVLYGSMDTRTVDSGEIMMGQYWHNTALTQGEMVQQVSLTHMKAAARL